MLEQVAEYINIVGKFCGKRDISELTQEELYKKNNITQVDVMVLFGGSILCGGDIMAQAIKNNIAKKYVIVGGVGHTTEALRMKMRKEFPKIETVGLPEAKVFDAYLKHQYGLEADFLECHSTNCGNNITYLLELLKENKVSFKTIILVQDATMQYRMEAGLKKYVNDEVKIINYAAYPTEVIVRNSELVFENEILGMWDMDRYVTLLMGEIPRLSDDKDGYGPNGKNYIAHVEIPQDVRMAFSELCKRYSGMIREANPLYASK